jgi:hypothetical protein
MAARENQGLQIALIIFVMLTILLGVSTYMLYSRYDETQVKLKAAVAASNEANDLASKEKASREAMQAIMGAAPTDSADAVIGEAKAVISQYVAMFNLSLPDPERTEKKVIAGLADTLRTANNNIARRDLDINQLKEQVLTDAKKADGKQKELEEALAKNVAELEAERTKYNDALVALKNSETGMTGDLKKSNTDKDKLKAEFDRKITEREAVIARLQKENAELKQELSAYVSLQGGTASAGKILWVNLRDNTVYLNLGEADNLRRGITFSVYPPGTTEVAKAISKGKIEVTRVTGPHSAEARIDENPLGDPLLPGDLVHTVGWLPGQQQHFAVAAYIDMDGTHGPSQWSRLHDLIVANGGIIDAEQVETTDPKNGQVSIRVKGRITVDTRYLIQGDLEPDKPNWKERSPGTKELQNEATPKNVETIGLKKFLDMMGYVPPASVKPGTTAEEAAKNPDGFKPRTPPSRGLYYKGGGF